MSLDCAFSAQFAFSAPKKLFPNATDRNHLKRLMRESVRLQKTEFYTALHEKNKEVALLLSYHAKKIADFKEVDASVTQLLKKLLNELH
jgi:ribonuclease P protein component